MLDKLWEHFEEHHMEQKKKIPKRERMGLLGGLSSNNDFLAKK